MSACVRVPLSILKILTSKVPIGDANTKKSPKTTPSLEARGHPSNTSMPGPTPLTTTNASSIALRTSAQLRNKSSIGYNGTPQIHPQNCPFLRRSPPKSNTPITRLTPLTTPNGIQIQSAVSSQLTFADRQTDRWSMANVCTMSAPLAMLIAMR